MVKWSNEQPRGKLAEKFYHLSLREHLFTYFIDEKRIPLGVSVR